MFILNGECLICNGKQTPIRRHWCIKSQIIIGLLLLQHKFVGGNIHSSSLRNALMSKPISMSPSRATKTMKALREGKLNKCDSCYDTECQNFECIHTCTKICKNKCNHICYHDICVHLCTPCNEKCQETHSYFTSLVDILDPRRSKMWISHHGLQYLDQAIDKIAEKTKQKSMDYTLMIGEIA